MMSKYLVLIQDAIAELLGQKLRTFLTMLGMIFGVGSVIAMLNIGEGAENEALKLIDSMGVNNIIVNAKYYEKEELSEIREESLGLNLGDVNAALATLPFCEKALPVNNNIITNKDAISKNTFISISFLEESWC
jgi:putative ABC transport system permease protein